MPFPTNFPGSLDNFLDGIDIYHADAINAMQKVLVGPLVINVKGQGGGTADDTAIINTALATANAAGGGRVVLDYMATCSGTVLNSYSNVHLVGNGWGTGITYSGSGVAVNMTNSRSGLADLRIQTTNGSATVVGLKISAAAGVSLIDWNIQNVDIQASVKTTGQVGLQFTNTATSNIYWGNAAGLTVENYDIGIDMSLADLTLGINANRFVAPFVHNCNTSLHWGNTHGNQFIGTQLELTLFGIKAASAANRNIFIGRCEGGVGGQSYQLAAGSLENFIVIDDNSPVASTDLGTDNQIISLAVGQGRAWEFQSMWMAPYYPGFANGSGTVPVGANNAQFVKLSGITKAATLTTVRYEVVNSAGNICLGLYELVGTNLTQRATTGSFACPAAGGREQAFAAGYTVRPGKTYYLAIAADGVVATFKALTGVSTNLVSVSSANVLGDLVYGTGAGGMMPLPATVAIGGLATDTKVFALIGK